jgi:hypothetical protein
MQIIAAWKAEYTWDEQSTAGITTNDVGVLNHGYGAGKARHKLEA